MTISRNRQLQAQAVQLIMKAKSAGECIGIVGGFLRATGHAKVEDALAAKLAALKIEAIAGGGK